MSLESLGLGKNGVVSDTAEIPYNIKDILPNLTPSHKCPVEKQCLARYGGPHRNLEDSEFETNLDTWRGLASNEKECLVCGF